MGNKSSKAQQDVEKNNRAKVQSMVGIGRRLQRTPSGLGFQGWFGPIHGKLQEHAYLPEAAMAPLGGKYGRDLANPNMTLWDKIKALKSVKKGPLTVREDILQEHLAEYERMIQSKDPLAQFFKRTYKNKNLKGNNLYGSSPHFSLKNWYRIQALRNAKYEMDPVAAEKYLKNTDPERFEKIKKKLENYYTNHEDEFDPHMHEYYDKLYATDKGLTRKMFGSTNVFLGHPTFKAHHAQEKAQEVQMARQQRQTNKARGGPPMIEEEHDRIQDLQRGIAVRQFHEHEKAAALAAALAAETKVAAAAETKVAKEVAKEAAKEAQEAVMVAAAARRAAKTAKKSAKAERRLVAKATGINIPAAEILEAAARAAVEADAAAAVRATAAARAEVVRQALAQPVSQVRLRGSTGQSRSRGSKMGTKN